MAGGRHKTYYYYYYYMKITIIRTKAENGAKTGFMGVGNARKTNDQNNTYICIYMYIYITHGQAGRDYELTKSIVPRARTFRITRLVNNYRVVVYTP
jgi:hypothetical protein